MMLYFHQKLMESWGKAANSFHCKSSENYTWKIILIISSIKLSLIKVTKFQMEDNLMTIMAFDNNMEVSSEKYIFFT